MSQDIEQYRSGFEAAEHSLKCGEEYPYDAAGPAKDWAHAAARGILYDLSDRRGIKHELRAVEPDVRDELTASLADIIRAASKREASTEPSGEEGGLLTESIDTEEFHELACSWKSDGDAVWSDIIDHIVEYTYREVEAARRAAAGAQKDEAKDAALSPELREVLSFLMGEAPLGGVWFGDRHPESKTWWWRTNLRAAIAAHTKAQEKGE